MLKGMTPEKIDDLVLQTLRKIAAEGQRGRIRGKAVRLAGPKDGDCVYKRAIMQALEDGTITLDASVLVIIALDPERDRYFQASMRRLIAKDLVFRHTTGNVQKRSYWVVID